jgi:hypothetical protein
VASKSRRRPRGSRRTPVRAQSGPSIPWVPLIAVAAVVGVVGLVIFLVIQTQSGGDGSDKAIAAEQDASTALPGQFIDLEAIYGGVYGATAGHVTNDVDYAAACTTTEPKLCNTNPPVGGPHWSDNCGKDPKAAPAFCGPAPWGIYRDPWSPETLVHNMEHGGVVIWYNTTNQQVIDGLESVIKDKLDDNALLVLAPYPDMEPDTVALTSWTRIDKFLVAQYSDDRVNTFISAHERRFNPEHF